MFRFRQSLGFRLLIIAFILLAFPLLVDSFILIRNRYEHTIADAKGVLVEMAALKEVPLLQLQSLDQPIIDLFTRYLSLTTDFPKEPSEELNEKLYTLEQIGNFESLALLRLDKDGHYRILASSDQELIGKDYTNFFNINDRYSKFPPKNDYDSYIGFDQKTLKPYFLVVHTIRSPQTKEILGAFVLTDPISGAIENLLKIEKRDYNVHFALLFPSSLIFAATDPDLDFHYFSPLPKNFKELVIAEAPEAIDRIAAEPLVVDRSIGPPFLEFRWKGHRQIGYIKAIPDVDYSLLVYTSQHEIFQAPFFAFFDIYSVFLLILLIGGILTLLITMRMSKPIRSLGLVMQKIQEGQVNLRYKKDPLGFEINDLGETFNGMVEAVLEQKHLAEEERVKREILAQELKLGRQVQRGLLPQTMPTFPGIELAEAYIPTLEVGGDFYDAFEEKGKMVLAVADVSGKGVQACLYSLSVRNMMRIYAKQYEDIAAALVSANNLFQIDTAETGMFVTVLGALYDPITKQLSYYSCGHNPGILCRKDGSIEVLKYGGMAMGVMEWQPQTSNNIQLASGDTLVFYTDGISEAHNPEFEQFGETRLIECIKNSPRNSAEEVSKAIIETVHAFVGTAPQHDDMTLLVMRVSS